MSILLHRYERQAAIHRVKVYTSTDVTGFDIIYNGMYIGKVVKHYRDTCVVEFKSMFDGWFDISGLSLKGRYIDVYKVFDLD